MTMFAWLALFAEDAPQQPQAPGFSFLIPMMLIFFVFYIFILRPMKQREAERTTKMMSALKKGDKVVTTAGIYGTVVSVAEKEDEVVVKVDDNTRLKMMKASIMRNITQEEAAVAAKSPQAVPGANSTAITTDRSGITTEKK